MNIECLRAGKEGALSQLSASSMQIHSKEMENGKGIKQTVIKLASKACLSTYRPDVIMSLFLCSQLLVPWQESLWRLGAMKPKIEISLVSLLILY